MKIFLIILITFGHLDLFAANLSTLLQANSSSSNENFTADFFSVGGVGFSGQHGGSFCKKRTVGSYGHIVKININEGVICDYDNNKFCNLGACTGVSGTKYLILYMSNITKTSNTLGPRATGDAFCSSNTPPGLTCTNKHAFLSYTSSDSISNMATTYSYNKNAPIYWFNQSTSSDNGRAASNFSELLNGSIETSALNGTGVDENYYTGSTFAGDLNGTVCNGWISASSGYNLTVGSRTSTGATWLNFELQLCWGIKNLRVLCLCEK